MLTLMRKSFEIMQHFYNQIPCAKWMSEEARETLCLSHVREIPGFEAPLQVSRIISTNQNVRNSIRDAERSPFNA